VRILTAFHRDFEVEAQIEVEAEAGGAEEE